MQGEGYLESFPSGNETFVRLSKFYRVNATLPFPEEKHIVGLFRKMIQMDSYVEELAKTKVLQTKNDHPDEKQEEEKKEEMEIEGFEDLPEVFISPIEKLMDELKESVK